MTTLQDLLAAREQLAQQLAQLDDQIVAARRAERSEVLASIRALMSKFGLTAADLDLEGRRPAPAPSKLAGKVVAARYRDPESGSTWTGRGLKPRWLVAALDAGKSIESFRL